MAGLARCNASTLTGKLGSIEAGAGNRYSTLLVTNTGSMVCTLYGYSGLRLLGGNGKPVPTDLERKLEPGPALVQLKPGATAAANLHWSVVPHGDEPQDGPCQPSATTAEVIPPDETQPLRLKWDYGLVCGKGHIEISAFYAA